jgi:predicted phage terminase large subunit-like protein
MRFDPALRKTTSLGFVDPRKKEGELLSPKRLSEKTVCEMEARLGKYHVAAQLQQNPSSREGVIFKKSDWKYYHVPPVQLAATMDEIIWSWDCTFKDTAGSDSVAGHCIGRKGANKYLLARVSEKMTFSKTANQVKVGFCSPHYGKKTVAVLVEDKANGSAVIDTLRDTIPSLIAITPQGGKIARANAVQPQHEAGNFYLPSPDLEGCAWSDEIADLFSRFTGVAGGVDDDVDAWTQGVSWFTTREGLEADSPAPAVGGSRVY